MAKAKKKQPAKTAAERKLEEKQAEKAVNRRGIIIVSVIVALFVAFIVIIALNGGNKENTSNTSTTEYNEEAVMQAVEDFEV